MDASSTSDTLSESSHKDFSRGSRLKKLLDETKGRVALGGQSSREDLFIAPTVVVDVDREDILMQDEVGLSSHQGLDLRAHSPNSDCVLSLRSGVLCKGRREASGSVHLQRLLVYS